jgi:hypothetical protein
MSDLNPAATSQSLQHQSTTAANTNITNNTNSSSSNLSNLLRLGESAYQLSDRINSELFSLTYGVLVVQLLKDYQNDVNLLNTELDRIGYSIGERNKHIIQLYRYFSLLIIPLIQLLANYPPLTALCLHSSFNQPHV